MTNADHSDDERGDEHAATPGRESLVDTFDVEQLDTADPAAGDYLGEIED
jgi:hypothetical protein